MNYYSDYIWKNGIPYGISKLAPEEVRSNKAYKIVMDPYRKRIAIEFYNQGLFDKIIYDSALLDFRHLNPATQAAWQREIMSDTPAITISLLRDQDDRVICIEQCEFEKHLCRKCILRSPHGQLISVHEMYYTFLNDPQNLVILYDSEQRPVMQKQYSSDETTGEFTTLELESWDVTKKKT